MDVDETEEDAEARNLLNKFIGSQVLLSGIESPVSTPGNVQRTIKITTSTTSSVSLTIRLNKFGCCIIGMPD